jgi:hypothetical protein
VKKIILQINITDPVANPDYKFSNSIDSPDGLFNKSNVHYEADWVLDLLLDWPDGFETNFNQLNRYFMTRSVERNLATKRLEYLGYLIIEKIDKQTSIWHVYDTPQNRTTKLIYNRTMVGK